MFLFIRVYSLGIRFNQHFKPQCYESAICPCQLVDKTPHHSMHSHSRQQTTLFDDKRVSGVLHFCQLTRNPVPLLDMHSTIYTTPTNFISFVSPSTNINLF